jgi:hypothetical protein
MDNGPHLFEQRGRIGGLENVAAEHDTSCPCRYDCLGESNDGSYVAETRTARHDYRRK